MSMSVRQQRLRALRDALRRAQSFGPFSLPVGGGLASGFLASFAVDAFLFERVDTPWRQLIDAAAFSLVAAPIWLAVQRPEVLHAIEVMTWLNGWETERWQKEIGRRLHAVPRAAPGMLDTMPDTLGLRPLRVELLAVRGEMDEAWDRLALLPADTPWQRFERAALEEWVSWVGNGPELIEPMESAAPQIDDEERSLVARAMIAAAQARRAAVTGGDVIAPLAALRPALGERPARYAFPYRTGVIVSVVLIGLIASLTVMIVAMVMR